MTGELTDRFSDQDAAESRAVMYRALAAANGLQLRYEVKQCQLPMLSE